MRGHKRQAEENKVPCDYEKMNDLLYAYRFGTISFLDLLAAFEEILHIKTHSEQSDAA